ncbi:HEPN domain-containing protein [Leptospira saintgironsiae]|uniref:RiboL-PSP-HEPN domain-containing protein n=1 Tax=Leptospira saintgironsiae TaxID=2023183 RepID=A0A2M9Y7G5_9LEPT|nr:HEPN domain-containing protein [Leptospira saintgironsiae]PJZ47497.1 hypothetical protein CH362_18905 [Leptospira saintgironsiae]
MYQIADDLKEGNVLDINKKKKALYKSTIVQLCAAWESFLEAAALNGTKFLAQEAKKSGDLPAHLLVSISNSLKNQKDERAIWKISDNGWREEIILNCERLSQDFNTARPKQIDKFICDTLGMKNLSHSWKWKNNSFEQSVKRLDKFMTLRGGIVHKLIETENIHLNALRNYTTFIVKLAIISSDAIREYLHSLVGKYPWSKVPKSREVD